MFAEDGHGINDQGSQYLTRHKTHMTRPRRDPDLGGGDHGTATGQKVRGHPRERTRCSASRRDRSAGVGGVYSAGSAVFVRRHQRAVYGLAFTMCRDSRLAEDLSQQTFESLAPCFHLWGQETSLIKSFRYKNKFATIK